MRSNGVLPSREREVVRSRTSCKCAFTRFNELPLGKLRLID
jgi:hypothetical protein